MIAAGALLLGACAPRPSADAAADSPVAGSSASAVPLPAAPVAPAGPVAPTRSTGGDAVADTATIARLEREARALAHTEGCAAAGQCRVAPLGHRACGGPRDYVAWCATSTDSAALYRALNDLARAEEAAQTRSGEASTCEYRMPPNPRLSGGRCATSASSGGRATVP